MEELKDRQAALEKKHSVAVFSYIYFLLIQVHMQILSKNKKLKIKKSKKYVNKLWLVRDIVCNSVVNGACKNNLYKQHTNKNGQKYETDH